MNIKRKTTLDFIRAVSGLFITPNNRLGITNKEMDILVVLIEEFKDSSITKVTKDIRTKVSNACNQSYQVTINYLNTLKYKGVLDGDFKPHPIFFKQSVTIENGTITMQPVSSKGDSQGVGVGLEDS